MSFAVHPMRLYHLLQSLTMKHEQTLCASSSSSGDTKTPSLRLPAWTIRYSKAKEQNSTSGPRPHFTCLPRRNRVGSGPPAASFAGEALPRPYPTSPCAPTSIGRAARNCLHYCFNLDPQSRGPLPPGDTLSDRTCFTSHHVGFAQPSRRPCRCTQPHCQPLPLLHDMHSAC